jgi:tetratricopeptide (TPR) repeat protein
LGVSLWQTGLLRSVAKPTVAIDPSVAWAARRPARLSYGLEQVEADLLPWYTVGLVQLGNEALSSRQPQKAIAAYRRALDRPGTKPVGPISYNLGLAYEDTGRKDLAIAAYQRGLAASPDFQPAAERLKLLAAQP